MRAPKRSLCLELFPDFGVASHHRGPIELQSLIEKSTARITITNRTIITTSRALGRTAMSQTLTNDQPVRQGARGLGVLLAIYWIVSHVTIYLAIARPWSAFEWLVFLFAPLALPLMLIGAIAVQLLDALGF